MSGAAGDHPSISGRARSRPSRPATPARSDAAANEATSNTANIGYSSHREPRLRIRRTRRNIHTTSAKRTRRPYPAEGTTAQAGSPLRDTSPADAMNPAGTQRPALRLVGEPDRQHGQQRPSQRKGDSTTPVSTFSVGETNGAATRTAATTRPAAIEVATIAPILPLAVGGGAGWRSLWWVRVTVTASLATRNLRARLEPTSDETTCAGPVPWSAHRGPGAPQASRTARSRSLRGGAGGGAGGCSAPSISTWRPSHRAATLLAGSARWRDYSEPLPTAGRVDMSGNGREVSRGHTSRPDTELSDPDESLTLQFSGHGQDRRARRSAAWCWNRATGGRTRAPPRERQAAIPATFRPRSLAHHFPHGR